MCVRPIGFLLSAGTSAEVYKHALRELQNNFPLLFIKILSSLSSRKVIVFFKICGSISRKPLN